MSFLFGLAFPLIYWPDLISPVSSPKVIVLSILVPLMLIGRKIEWSPTHSVLMLFFVWCALSLLWALSLADAIYRLWIFALGFGIFAICSTMTERSLTRLFVGFAAGMGVNGLVAGFQLFGWDKPIFDVLGWPPFVTASTWASGLMVNGNYLAEAGLVAVALAIGLRRWLWAILALPCLAFAGSKGALVAGSLVLCRWLWTRSRVLALAVPLVMILGGIWHVNKIGLDHPSLETRIPMYVNSLAAWSWAGHGVGSYWSVYPTVYKAIMLSPPAVYSYDKRPRTAHNDAITVLVENGIIGLALALWFCGRLYGAPRANDLDRACGLALLAFLLLGIFNFPLYVPTTMVMAAAAAGALCRVRA